MKNESRKFLTGNEAIAEAARMIDFHFMGYYPITPSTEIAELLDEMKSKGEIRTVMLPADGEHGAAGACFGASTGGARVLNATSANGLLYSIEQLPAQAGARLPMVLNLVTRSVSAPLDIRCDHSDLMYALQTGWLVLAASTAQSAYDFNLFAVKWSEDPHVRLPVIVATDGFFTSHERQSLDTFTDAKTVQNFIGLRRDPYTTLDPRKPITIGPYMNDPDLVNNKFQLHQAHEAARSAFETVSEEYFKISGRKYSAVESYQMEDADFAIILLNSAAETAKDAIDQARAKGVRVGLIKPNVLRPFPIGPLQALTQNLKGLMIGERADTPGAHGGILSNEIRAALQEDPRSKLPTFARIFGLGGQNFTTDDAAAMIDELVSSSPATKRFDFFGTRKGNPEHTLTHAIPPLTHAETHSGLIQITSFEKDGLIFPSVTAPPPSTLAGKAKRIAPGHGACPGCGIFSGIDQFLKGIEGDIVVLYHTGCAMVVTTGYPFSSHRVTYLHNLFQNGAPTLSGLVEVFHEKKRRGEITASENITFIMITGDGGMDIGMGPTIGTALRNHPMIILEYDNQGYMNTGGQLSYTTPQGHRTSTSHVGSEQSGKSFPHKDTLAIMAATGIPYCFSAIESCGTDLVEKAAKAQWYSQNHGLSFGKLLISCPLNWKSEERMGQTILQKAVDTCFFPLFEVEQGKTRINYDPELEGKKVPITEWLKMMGKTAHLLKPENKNILDTIQDRVDRQWARLKARHDHLLL